MDPEEHRFAYDTWRAAADKFDYFVLGLTGAVCAYISQHISPKPIGFTPNTLEMLALILLLTSMVAGFRRIEKSIVIHSVTYQLMEREGFTREARNNLEKRIVDPDNGKVLFGDEAKNLVAKIERRIVEGKEGRDKAKRHATCTYSWRNRFLLVGVVALLASKIWSAYV
mgnify:CR=1 FL=1